MSTIDIKKIKEFIEEYKTRESYHKYVAENAQDAAVIDRNKAKMFTYRTVAAELEELIEA